MRSDFPRARILTSIKASHDRHRDEVAEALTVRRADVAGVLEPGRAEFDVTTERARDGSLGPRDDLHGLRRHRLPDPPLSHDDDAPAIAGGSIRRRRG